MALSLLVTRARMVERLVDLQHNDDIRLDLAGG